MKKWYQLMGLVILLIAVGVILVGVGTANGGRTYIDITNMFDEKRQKIGLDDVGENVLEAFNSLELKAEVAQIEIIKGNDYSIRISGSKNNDISYKTEKGRLQIIQKGRKRGMIGFKWINMLNHETITVCIPQDAKIQDLYLECGIGDVMIREVSADNMILTVGTGTLEINNVSSDKCRIRGGISEVKANTFTANTLDVEAGVGEIDIQGDFKGDVHLNGGIGEIELRAKGQESDFNYSFEKGMGDIKLNGEFVSNIKHTENNAAKTITAKAGIGSIDIDIEE